MSAPGSRPPKWWRTRSCLSWKRELAWRFRASPHAPYTVSRELMRLAKDAALTGGAPLMMHLAESSEEMEMFRDGKGRLFDLLRSLGRPMDDCGRGKTPLEVYLEQEVLDERWIIVHLNELAEEDFARLERGRGFTSRIAPGAADILDIRRFLFAGWTRSGSTSRWERTAWRATRRSAFSQKCKRCATRSVARAATDPRDGHDAPGAGSATSDLARESTRRFPSGSRALPVENPATDLFEKIVAWQEPVPG